MTHDWQVPMPQPIIRSMHTWQGIDRFSQVLATAASILSGPQV